MEEYKELEIEVVEFDRVDVIGASQCQSIPAEHGLPIVGDL